MDSKPCKTVTRKKILVIPYTLSRINGRIVVKYVMVKDHKTNEWGFISGGVKKGEKFENAARRELSEETSELISFPDNTKLCKTFRFDTLYRPNDFKKIDNHRREIVNSRYKTFMFAIDYFDDVKHEFIENKEVVAIDLREYEDFKKNDEKIWSFCEDVYTNYLK